ncbi:Long-chain-fatty-acid--CoA ligase [Usitatibacter rugosus]|uniref:Long-chain-fatty-acid--CoA ligase n=1 Tax=Usitatibacter rugosus TaxID=2732067 RepID=A0A6M4GXW6_9PROT|nr:AMP-binding protein [Usitatibacter rugosus]QJR11243.1 Long-chain-fatty-acid--CoA ligase [Usitatibacter rugosus]
MQAGPDAYPSVVAMLEEAMQRYTSKTAFRCAGQSLTYAEVDRQSRAFAAYLQQRLGVRKGDRVAIMLPNILAFPVAMIGILRAGAVQVNVNPMYTPRELEYQLNDAGAKTIVVGAAAAATLAQVVERTAVKNVIAEPAGFAQALDDGAGLPFTPVPLTGEDILFLQYTGGTTGLSKGAALSHRNLIANTQQLMQVVPEAFRPGEVVIATALPLYHIFALMVNLVSAFVRGAENWLIPNPRDLDAYIDVLKQARFTIFTGVNTLYGGLAAHPRIREVDFSRLACSIGGGSTILPVTSARWKAITGQDILEGYGLSETGPILTLNHPGGDGFSATVGPPFPGTQIKLLGDDGQEVPPGEAGEVCAQGPQVMGGYWEKAEANAAAFTADGFFRTGDIGVFDARGNLKIVDRKKDMVLVSGFNVYPNEIEAIASACPGVLECACIGVPDEKTGEAVRLYVVPIKGTPLTEAQVIEHCKRGLSSYKVPKQVRFAEALPKSTVGKILRRELRALA